MFCGLASLTSSPVPLVFAEPANEGEAIRLESELAYWLRVGARPEQIEELRAKIEEIRRCPATVESKLVRDAERLLDAIAEDCVRSCATS